MKWLFVWAFTIGLSQVYVGVHFFSDVIAGFLLGFILASLVYFPAKYFLKSS
ncbi:MAG: phosphatase PAP2 family protein [Saprospiraceae bacterium]|nr:phosphatase PAP2 family protein [Saprospiraceae bacterium]